jgi:hypothetical protein
MSGLGQSRCTLTMMSRKTSDGEPHVFPRASIRDAPRGVYIKCDVVGVDCEPAAIGHGVPRVDRKVEDRIFDIAGVGQDLARVGDNLKEMVTCSPSVRLSSSILPVTRSLRSRRSSPTPCRLERKSSLRVRLAPIWMASIAPWITVRIFWSGLRNVIASR